MQAILCIMAQLNVSVLARHCMTKCIEQLHERLHWRLTCASIMQVMKAFYLLPVPQPGEEVEFLPDRELQPVHYARPRIVDLTERFVHRSPLAAAEAEAAEALQCWTVACLCRSLSIDNIITFLTGVLATFSETFIIHLEPLPHWAGAPPT